jgi:hypothetical protein
VNGSGQRVRRTRRVVVLAAAVVCLGVVVASPLFGTAHPTGAFRAPVTTPQLAGACSPLPDGVTLDFAHQVRSDRREGNGEGGRRAIRVQVDLIDVDEVEREVEADLVAVGFREQAAGDGTYRYFRRDDYGVVGLAVEPLWDDRADAIVRGVLRLKLPVTTYQDEPPRCRRGVG